MSTLSIVVVDDELPYLMMIDRFLKRYGCSVMPWLGGHGAYTMIKSVCPDLVLLDLNMGDVSGIDVLRELRSDALTRDIPVVICSGEQIPARPDAREIGQLASAILCKPFDLALLRGTLERLLRTELCLSKPRQSRGAS